MGLAASQARFLAITSRKANCEFESMQIAQNKLSITRELAQVSHDYQNALNKTTLVWDYDGSGENTYDLSYGVLMTPTIMNNFNPYLITTRTGSVVLNGQMASAAKIISPNGAPVTRSAAGFHEFMEALGQSGILPESTAKAITDLTDLHYVNSAKNEFVNPSIEQIMNEGLRLNNTYKSGTDQKLYVNGYNKDAGYGAEPLNKNGATARNLTGLAYQVKDVDIGSAIIDTFRNNNKKKHGFSVTENGRELTDDEIKSLTLEQVLTKNIVIREQGEDNNHSYEKFLLGNLLTTIISTSHTAFKNVLGVDLKASQSLELALVQTNNQYNKPKNISADHLSSKSSWKRATENVNNNNVVFVKNDGKDYNSTAGVNLTNLMAYYLTLFDLSYNGYGNSAYNVGPTASTSSFVTSDPYYNYVMKSNNSVDNDTVMKADFYMQIYNNICINGWTQSEGDIEDNQYLEQMLKNGNYFVTSLNEDGYFYQGRYNEGDCIIEVKDEDAIAQAEAEFTSKKARLTYKEEQLDLDMKNLDAEISSLTTEYDTVKNLISKNIEKVFSMFQ